MLAGQGCRHNGSCDCPVRWLRVKNNSACPREGFGKEPGKSSCFQPRFTNAVRGIVVAAILTVAGLLGGFVHFRQSVMDARRGKFNFKKSDAKLVPWTCICSKFQSVQPASWK